VFRRFQPGDVPLFVNHAHNDYLEWLFEGGLATAILLLAFLTLYVLRWRQIWPTGNGRWAPITFVRIAAGISLLLIGLHGLIDFNLHIPANAAFFAFLAGVFFHPGAGQRAAESGGKPEATKQVVSARPTPLPVAPQAPLDVRNPFAD
jgi:O-antigen ligase